MPPWFYLCLECSNGVGRYKYLAIAAFITIYTLHGFISIIPSDRVISALGHSTTAFICAFLVNLFCLFVQLLVVYLPFLCSCLYYLFCIWDSSDEEFMIITDSLSSLQALKSQKLNNPIVSNILHMCHYLSGHKDIIFCWVPSHIGIQGNERADVFGQGCPG